MRVLAIVHQRDAGAGVFAEETRERGVEFDEWLIAEQPEPPADPAGYDAVMIFGGAMNTHEEEMHPWIRREKDLLAELLDRGTPLLGACLGTQLLADAAGGEVRRSREPEIGWHEVSVRREARGDPLFGDPPLRDLAPYVKFVVAPGSQDFQAFQWHSYEASRHPGRSSLAAEQGLSAGLPDRRAGLGRSSSTPRSPRPTSTKWIDGWRERRGRGADRARPGGAACRDPGEKIAGWNEFGRDLCGRFLDQLTATRA